jgi:chitin synthase
MLSSEIAALSIGTSIVLITVFLFLLVGSYKDRSMFTNQKVFFIKKWIYITGIVLLNAGFCCLVYYTQNLQVILYIILILKSKDILMSVIFPFNMLYKSFFTKNELEVIEKQNNNIIAFVPAYKETIEQVTKTVDSLIENIIGSNNLVIFIVSDGVSDYKDIIDNVVNATYQKQYKSWKGNMISNNIYFGTRKNRKIILINKGENVGKKDSIILANKLFNSNLSDDLDQFKEEINSDINSIFGIEKFDYMFVTDADTVVDKNVCLSLIDNIQKRNAVASCGIVNVDFSCGNFYWNKLQNFQYLYGQYLRRSCEDLFNQVLCLPGCISMFKLSSLPSEALDKFSKIPNDCDVVISSIQYVGTDRRYTSTLVYTNENAKIVLDTRCHAYTVPPSNLQSYVSQRRRWCQNMYFNSMVNIIGSNINVVLRFFNFIDYMRLSLVYFRLFNTLYFIYLLVASYEQSKILEILPYIILSTYPVLCFMIYSLFNSHLRKQWFSLLFALVFNKLFVFLSSILIFTNMLFNIGSEYWNTNVKFQQV